MTGNVKLSVWRTPDFVEYDTPIYLAGYVARMDRPPSRGECVRCARPIHRPGRPQVTTERMSRRRPVTSLLTRPTDTHAG
jgi:hypothetical protein